MSETFGQAIILAADLVLNGTGSSSGYKQVAFAKAYAIDDGYSPPLIWNLDKNDGGNFSAIDVSFYRNSFCDQSMHFTFHVSSNDVDLKATLNFKDSEYYQGEDILQSVGLQYEQLPNGLHVSSIVYLDKNDQSQTNSNFPDTRTRIAVSQNYLVGQMRWNFNHLGNNCLFLRLSRFQ